MEDKNQGTKFKGKGAMKAGKGNPSSKLKKSGLLLSVDEIIDLINRDAYSLSSDGGGTGRSDNNDQNHRIS